MFISTMDQITVNVKGVVILTSELPANFALLLGFMKHASFSVPPYGLQLACFGSL